MRKINKIKEFKELIKSLKSQNLKLLKEKRRQENVKDEFISIAAHQLRTPLSIMRLNLELLYKKSKSAKFRNKIYTNVYQSTIKMIDLVNDLLTIARINQGNPRIKPQKIDIIKFLTLISTQQKPEIKKRKLKFKLIIPKEFSYKIAIDPDLLFEVIANILANAVKYSIPKRGKIILSLEKKANRVIITTTDNGIGIPKKEQNRIFSKFYRTSIARLNETEGSGLGMFIAKSFVESWGGKIGFKSPVFSKNRGTSVYFTIPLK